VTGESDEMPEVAIDDYHRRKQERTDLYMKYVYKNKLVTCTACNGSGCYDNTGSPKCSSCNGTGKERER